MNCINKFGRNIIYQLKLHNNSLTFNSIFQQTRAASLYGPANLGVDKYSEARDQFMGRMGQMISNFRVKMTDFTKEGSHNMIFTDDLKSMVHLCTASDVELLEKMIKKFNTQNKEMRFGSYVFGPVIMRMFYFLDLPNEAYKVFKDPEVSGFFDQLTTYHILMDLLYKHNKFDEVLDVFRYIKAKQTGMLKFPKHILVLATGALYKQNTQESLKEATKIWSEINEVGHHPMRRAASFVAALAMNQGAPHIALEILGTIRNQNYYSVRNMKIYALAEVNRPEDAFPIIRTALEFDGPTENTPQFLQESIERLQAATERSNNSDMKREFSQLMKAISDRNCIDKQRTIDDLLAKEMVVPQQRFQGDDQQLHQSFSNRTSDFNRRPTFSRPTQGLRSGLSDRY